MGRLDEIVERMESSRLPLHELLASYEEGTKLVRVCTEHLNTAEQRIEIITRNAQGEPAAVPLIAGAELPKESRRAARSAVPKSVSIPPAPASHPDEVSLF